MVVARKSAVSPRGNWFRRDSILSLGTRNSARRKSAARSGSTPSAQTTPTSSQKQHSSKNFSEQSSRTQKSPGGGFLRLPTVSNSGVTPLWLLRLYTFHRYSSVLAFLLVVATLAAYGWTVYSQQLWSQSYSRLQKLQRHERLLTTTNATLTNKMAEEAEQPTTGLVSPTPQGMIFLPPAPHSLKPASSNTTPNSEMQQQTSWPLGGY
ncbi:hypothetical protein [Nostoc sp.]|uniref:hypothetical protein n=1 Tax=Nostoc sp. TaxID=1180 RepID=UPI003593AA21